MPTSLALATASLCGSAGLFLREEIADVVYSLLVDSAPYLVFYVARAQWAQNPVIQVRSVSDNSVSTLLRHSRHSPRTWVPS